ncbi:MAG: DNA-binding transcriptional regulator Fis [Coxiellaceae bacterium]|nr:DNA-binding transcriptional regulator Fis [Coxiellaceae bacterium]
MENKMLALSPELLQTNNVMSLQESVSYALQQYFAKLDGQTPANLYELVLAEVEKPLIEMVLKLTNENQSKAAIMLGISRGTLRKKMALYNLN